MQKEHHYIAHATYKDKDGNRVERNVDVLAMSSKNAMFVIRDLLKEQGCKLLATNVPVPREWVK